MNIFQVLNQRRQSHQISRKDTFRLIGARISREQSGPMIPVQKASVRCSQLGMGIEKDLEVLSKIQEDSEDSEQAYLKKDKKFTISMKNRIKRPFDVLMDFLPFASILSSMYFLAYEDPSTGEMIFDTVLWVLFIVDFLLSFFTEFRDKKKRKVRNLKLIALNYAKGFMIPDAIALIPLRFAGDFKAECILRLFRIARVSKIFNFVNVGWVCEFISGLIYKNECLAKKKLKMKILTMWEILKQVLTMFFITLILACVWYAFINFIIEKENESVNFISNFGLQENSNTERFIKTWYYIFTTLATVGFGDFYAVNKYEQCFAILLLLAGPTWFAFVMGNAISFINSLNDLTGIKQNKTNLQKWLGIFEYLYKELTLDLKQQIMTHYVNLWKNDRLGTLYNCSQENDFSVDKCNDPIYSNLPQNLRNELIDYLFSDIIYKFNYFFKCFDEAKYELCRFLEPRVYKKKSILVSFGGTIEEFLFVNSGTIEVSVIRDDYEINLFKFTNQCILGDYYIIKKIKSPVEYTAFSTVKGFGMPVYAFKEIVKAFNFNLNTYEKKIKPFYKEMNLAIKSALDSRPVATKEKENEYLNEKFSPTTGETNFVSFDDKSEYLEDEKENVVFREMENVDNILKNCNSRRVKILNNLKDQISNHVFRKTN